MDRPGILVLIPRIERRLRQSEDVRAFNQLAIPTVIGALLASVFTLLEQLSKTLGVQGSQSGPYLPLIVLPLIGLSALQVRFRWPTLGVLVIGGALIRLLAHLD